VHPNYPNNPSNPNNATSRSLRGWLHQTLTCPLITLTAVPSVAGYQNGPVGTSVFNGLIGVAYVKHSHFFYMFLNGLQ
jgi:hypothetical protein